MYISVALTATAGFCDRFPMLVTVKILQGVASAGIGANDMAVVAETFPDRELSKVLGPYVTIIGIGVAIGPVVGGHATRSPSHGNALHNNRNCHTRGLSRR